MKTGWDLIDFRDLPSFLFLVAVLELLLPIDHELKDAIGRLIVANRVFSVLELDLTFAIKVDGVRQIIVNESVHHVCLIRLQ